MKNETENALVLRSQWISSLNQGWFCIDLI